MTCISSFSLDTNRKNPFPYNIPAVKFAGKVDLSSPITILVGDNGTGKSTLLETLGYRMNLPLIGEDTRKKAGMDAAIALQPYLDIEWNIELEQGFFFRAEDFGQFVDKIEKENAGIEKYYASLRGEVEDSVIQRMKDNSNKSMREMRKTYGQDMQAFSHGEAYLKIIHDRIQGRGVFLLDEPEAALSPAKQLSLIYFINDYVSNNVCQFVIATHSPMLMALPGATIYEITEDAMMKVSLEETDHFTITRNFLNNPDMYLRHLS